MIKPGQQIKIVDENGTLKNGWEKYVGKIAVVEHVVKADPPMYVVWVPMGRLENGEQIICLKKENVEDNQNE
jgi:hypothetical protein